MSDTYTIIDYFDVWGNAESGWEVNNLCEAGTIELNNYASKNEIVIKLIDSGFLTTTTRPEVLDIWNDYEMIEIFVEETREPLCRLELVRE